MSHLDLVGWVNPARYKWAQIMGREIKFKPATFYLGIVDHLARVVEGQQTSQPDERTEHTQIPGCSREQQLESGGDKARQVMVESLAKGEGQSSRKGKAHEAEGNTSRATRSS